MPMNPWPADLSGRDAYPILIIAIESGEVTNAEFDTIIEAVKEVGDSVVLGSFYPALELLLDTIRQQPENQRCAMLRSLARPILFAIEQEPTSCRQRYAEAFNTAIVRAREMYYYSLQSADRELRESLLLGICACFRDARSANAIRDIDC